MISISSATAALRNQVTLTMVVAGDRGYSLYPMWEVRTKGHTVGTRIGGGGNIHRQALRALFLGGTSLTVSTVNYCELIKAAEMT